MRGCSRSLEDIGAECQRPPEPAAERSFASTCTNLSILTSRVDPMTPPGQFGDQDATATCDWAGCYHPAELEMRYAVGIQSRTATLCPRHQADWHRLVETGQLRVIVDAFAHIEIEQDG